MAIDKIQTAGLGENIEIGGTEAAKMPVGTTAQRANVKAGDIRFNSTLSLMEYYTGVEWKSIDSPPTISSISPSTFSASGDTITVNGSNFQTGVNVTMIASDGTTYTPDSVTRVSSSQLTFDISSSIVADEADPWDVKVENISGLSVTSNDVLTLAGTISLNTPAGSLGTVYDLGRSSLSYDLGVTSSVSESDVTFTYSVSSGSLPSGLSLNTSTGAVTGTANAVGSDTTSNFTITYLGADASDSSYAPTAGTAYSLTIAAPVIQSFTSVGSGTFSIPTGVSSMDVLVVAGGGAGGTGNANEGGGGGGAGGLIYRPAFPVTPGSSASYTVGASGQPNPNQQSSNGTGGDSVFSTLTAIGGGYGGNGSGGGSGGSGGGGSGFGNPWAGGSGQQPGQPGDSGTYGFGTDGGLGRWSGDGQNGAGGGGGGAGSQGGQAPAPSPTGAPGGSGRSYSISGSSITYAEGGRGGNGRDGNYNGADATANRGTGAGGGSNPGTGNNPGGGVGGSGIVIVKY